MNIFKIDENDIDRAAPLVADFRVELCSSHGQYKRHLKRKV